jgi:hypothetical protein
VLPIIRELRAGAVVSANGVAAKLNERRVPTARGASGRMSRWRQCWLVDRQLVPPSIERKTPPLAVAA